MNLIDLFDTLTLPNDNEKILNAVQIPKFPNSRIAVNFEGHPIILLSFSNTSRNIGMKNFKLKYLQLEQNVECKILDNRKSSFQAFTVITFKSTDRNLQDYFLIISETLLRSLGSTPTPQQLIDTLNQFIEIFRSLSDTPTNTVQGLWSELFLIDNSKTPATLLDYWHNKPEEKFDFNSEVEKIEVKSNSNFERTHIFSADQLNTPSGTLILIASVFAKQSTAGQNIRQLIDSIGAKINFQIDLMGKLNNIICKTLGSSIEQSIGIKFDYQIAKDSLRFYDAKDIRKIEKLNIPTEVSEVKFKSDLSRIKSFNLVHFSNKQTLLKNL